MPDTTLINRVSFKQTVTLIVSLGCLCADLLERAESEYLVVLMLYVERLPRLISWFKDYSKE